MPRPRTSLNRASETALTAQVGSRCPRCSKALFYKKSGRDHKGYEIAHIYPLNPTPAELRALAGVPVLNPDPNHADNLIPLCTGCHNIFDKPRTRAEYDEMFALKKALLLADQSRDLSHQYQLDEAIREVVEALHRATPDTHPSAHLSYVPRRLDEKFNGTLLTPTRQKIRNNVRDYYSSVREAFLALEREEPHAAQLVYAQVRVFFLSQQAIGLSQPQIFSSVVDWIAARSQSSSREAAEAMASFFVQNCEVFE